MLQDLGANLATPRDSAAKARIGTAVSNQSPVLCFSLLVATALEDGFVRRVVRFSLSIFLVVQALAFYAMLSLLSLSLSLLTISC